MFISDVLPSDLNLIKSEGLISTCDCSRILACGYSDGIVRLVFNLDQWNFFSFVAFDKELLGLKYAAAAGFLIFWGSDADSQLLFRACDLTYLRSRLHESGASIKIVRECPAFQTTNVTNTDKTTQVESQQCARESYISTSSQCRFAKDVITCFSISPCGSVVAAGTKVHGVYIYMNYIINVKTPTFIHIGSGQFSNNPIKWLELQSDFTLYVATESGIWRFAIKNNCELVRYFVPPPSWGNIRSCLYFEEGKLLALGNTLSMVSDWKPLLSSDDCTLVYKYKSYIILTTNSAVQVYCIYGQMKFTAYTCKIENILFVICSANGIFVIGTDKLVYLKELSLPKRISYLLKKRCFKVAIDVCERENAPIYLVNEVYRVYSETLFRTGQISQATRIYCDNIGCVEPSLVISKLATCSNLPFLSMFLIALHEKGVSKFRHTFILFQTFAHMYTRLPKSTKLWSQVKSFISKFGESHNQSISGALEACRRSVSIEFVKQVAKLQSNHSLYLDILINDIQDYEGAVEYIKFLSIPDSCSALLQHGKVLSRHSDELIPLVRQVLAHSNADLDAFTPLFLSNNSHLRALVDSDEVFSDHLSTSSFSALMDAFLRYKTDDMERVWKLLNQRVFGESHLQIALVLVVFYNFKDGIESIAAKMRLHSLLFAINSDKLSLDYGESDPVLWSETLFKIVKLGRFDQVERYLEHCHKSFSLPCILNILGKNCNLPLRVAKNFLVKEFTRLKASCRKIDLELAQLRANSGQLSNRGSINNNGGNGNTEKSPQGVTASMSDDEFFKFLNGAHDPIDFVSQQFKWGF